MQKHLKHRTTNESPDRSKNRRRTVPHRFKFAAVLLLIAGEFCARGQTSPSSSTNFARVVIVENTNATVDFQPDNAVVRQMLDRAVTALANETNGPAAWRRFVSPNDVVGIKVFS